MWSFSQSLMLFQNCVAWLKWSLKLGLRSRTLGPACSLHRDGAERRGRAGRVHGAAAAQAVGEVRDAALVDGHAGKAVALIVVDRPQRAVDRQLVEVRPDAAQLRVDVGEQPALQQRIVGEVDAGNDVAGVEGDLLGLGEEVVRVAVQRQLADLDDRHELLGNDLGRVEQIEAELVLVLLLDDLQAELPFREVAALDRLRRDRGD